MTPDLPHLRGLTDVLTKSLPQERELANLNELLAPIQRQLEERTRTDDLRPVVLILGAPRSGTTLMSQLLAATGLFGWVDNFAARFWHAPALGMKISHALGMRRTEISGSFASTRGVTRGWSEPSEFGYFWSRYFDLGQATHKLNVSLQEKFDRDGLRRAASSMQEIAGSPMMFKNNTWFTFHAKLLAEVFDKAIFVACRRDAFFIAQSLWLQRLDLYGDSSRWWSVKPPNYDEIRHLPPIEQVAAQAVSIEIEMARSLDEVSKDSVIDAHYSRLVDQPREIVSEIAHATGIDNADVARALEQLPNRLQSTDIARLAPECAVEMRRAVDFYRNKFEA